MTERATYERIDSSTNVNSYLEEDEMDAPKAKLHDPIIFQINRYPQLHLRLSTLKYLNFALIGIALLWPWNCFLSASAYYSERFQYHPSLVKIYSSTMMTVSTLTSTSFNYVLSQKQAGANYVYRVKLGLILTMGIFIFMAISCVAFLDVSSLVYFPILMVMVFLSAVSTCLSQNGCMAIVNVMGPIYANGVMVGQAVAGVLPSIALIISILAVQDSNLDVDPNDDEKIEANYGLFVYYLTASIVALLSLLFFNWTNSYNEDKEYRPIVLTNEDSGASESVDEEDLTSTKKHVPFSLLWSKLKFIVSTIFLTFSITLIFPVFASSVESVHSESSYRFFNKQIFVPFIYLLWNLGDLIGRIICAYPIFQITNPKTLILYSICRLVFIPLFWLCNIHNKGGVINSDLIYGLLQLLFGLSNGQLCSSAFMSVGQFVEDDEKEAAGGFTTVFLSVGLTAGSILSYLFVALI